MKKTKEELKINQLQVLNLLLSGETITDAAAATGVSRGAVHSWFRNDAVFVAAWNELKLESLTALRGRINALSGRAIETLETVLNDPKAGGRLRLQVALRVLAASGCLSPEPPGSTSLGMIRQKLFLENHFE